MADRVTSRGISPFLNDKAARRVTAIGSTTGYSKEEIREHANAGIVEIVESTPSVDITIDTNEYGSMRTLALLSGKSADAKFVDFANDFDSSMVDLYCDIRASETETWTKYIENASITSASFQFSVDGNFTESYSLNSDFKKFFLNGAKHVLAETVEAEEEGVASITFPTEVHGVLAVYINDKKIDSDKYTTSRDSGVVDVESSLIKAGDEVRVRVTHSEQGMVWTTEPDGTPGALRSGHIEVSLLTDVVHDGGTGLVTSATEHKLRKAQSLGIDVSLDREELRELGSSRVYARPLNYPIGVDVSLDMLHADLELFTLLTGKDVMSATEISVDDVRDDLGLRVRLYKERDIDGRTEPIKTFDIPYLIANDEAWNSTLDANTTQTFSFRAHQLRVYS